MSEERKYGIRRFDIGYDPNTFMPVYQKYQILEWGGFYNEYEIADEPLTYEEAQALLKVLNGN